MTMLRYIILLLLLFGYRPMMMAEEDDIAQRCALMAARGDVLPLRQLYDSISCLPASGRDSLLSPHLALFCRLAFARGAGDDKAVVSAIDTLERKYESHLDVRGLLALCDVRCEALRRQGLWRDLQAYCKERLHWCVKRSIKTSRRKNLQFYAALASRFADLPPTSVQWTTDSCAVPISRDWPLLIPASINGSESMPFLFNTGLSLTMVSESDLKEWGIALPQTEPLTLSLPTGNVKVQPVVLERLEIGGVTMSNFMVYAVGKDVGTPFNRSLGTDVLRHLQAVVLTDQQLLAYRCGLPAAWAPDATFPIAFSASGMLHAFMPDAGDGSTRFALDTGKNANMLSQEGGVLGVAFFRSSRYALLDFQRMRFERQHDREYAPKSVEAYIQENDAFGLLRNEASLLFTISEADAQRMDAYLTLALTPPSASDIPASWHSYLIDNEESIPEQTVPQMLLNSTSGLLMEVREGYELKTKPMDETDLQGHRIFLPRLLLY